MINYRWEFGPAVVRPMVGSLSNVVVEMNYRLIGERDGREAILFGRVPLGDPDPANYTPMSDLTKDDIQGWIENTCDIDALKKEVADKLNAPEPEAAPVVVELPFNQPPETET